MDDSEKQKICSLIVKQQDNYNIEIKNLTVGYSLQKDNFLEVLRGINLSASPGEMVALIGSNGIGKSTLLKTLVGFQSWVTGDIRINNSSLKTLKTKEVAKIMSFVSTESILVPNLSVYELVSLGRFPYTNWIGTLSQHDREVVSRAIEKVGLRGFEQRPVLQISDGERQRAMIARALAQDTPVIILDEPTAFLDVSNKYEIFHLLQMLAADKKSTIILSTHDLNIALREVDKLWVITETANYQGAPEDAVLKGWLNQLFRNEHIGFDEEEGEFYFKKSFRAKVKVEGSGLPLIWTLRALNRKGFQIVMKAEPDYRIVAEEKNWKLIYQNSIKEFQSIYHLIAFMNANDTIAKDS
ncbi:MAG: ABC transporter ATP-binding protein [Prolixibacteraceae bacterium]|nr:ABC transporter ATP-binding protein [Prolixibacteraceae bacterium]